MTQTTDIRNGITAGKPGGRILTAVILTALAWISLLAGFLPAPIFAITAMILAVSAFSQKRNGKLLWVLIALNLTFMAVFVLLMVALTPAGYAPTISHSVPLS